MNASMGGVDVTTNRVLRCCCCTNYRWNCETFLKKIYWWEEEKAMRQNILLRQCTTPQRFCLSNGQSFLPRDERESRQNLPRNVTIKQTRWIGPRNRRARTAQKCGSMLVELVKLGTKLRAKILFKKGVSYDSKVCSSEIGKNWLMKEYKMSPTFTIL